MFLFMYGFFCHWFADFVCQSREMGEKKSKNFGMLVYHVVTYTLVMFLLLLLIIGFENAFKISIINGSTHLIIDGITSKITSYFYTNNKMHAFFTTIGFDQFLHACVLIWTINHFIGA